MLSFEVIESGKAIQICADDEELRVLRKALVIRRFKRGWTNFLDVYQPLADHWAIYENSESKPKLLERGP